MLFQVRGNAETFASITTTLPQVLGCATPSLIHIFIQQRQEWLVHLSVVAVTYTAETVNWVEHNAALGYQLDRTGGSDG